MPTTDPISMNFIREASHAYYRPYIYELIQELTAYEKLVMPTTDPISMN